MTRLADEGCGTGRIELKLTLGRWTYRVRASSGPCQMLKQVGLGTRWGREKTEGSLAGPQDDDDDGGRVRM